MMCSFLKYKALFSNYVDFRVSSISKQTLKDLLPKLGMKFKEDVLENSEIRENFYEYEAAFKLSLVNYANLLK